MNKINILYTQFINGEPLDVALKTVMNIKSHKPLSEKYLKWIKDTNQKSLTNTQSKFAEWLLEEDQIKKLMQMGDLNIVFTSIRDWLKKGKFE